MDFKHEASGDFWNRLETNNPDVITKWAERLTREEGYQIQLELSDRLADVGNSRAGWKVATISKILQEQLGSSEPFFGSVRKKTVFEKGYELPMSRYLGPHVETEICFKVAQGIETAYTAEDVRKAVECCYPAFELIEKRLPVRGRGTGLADNAEHKAIVLGAPVKVTPGLALNQETATLRINDHEMGIGSGSAILGDPINSIVWLNNKLREFGRNLKPGELVMTGSIIRQHPLQSGDRVSATFSTLGEVFIRVVD